jgi:hypothetical protein
MSDGTITADCLVVIIWINYPVILAEISKENWHGGGRLDCQRILVVGDWSGEIERRLSKEGGGSEDGNQTHRAIFWIVITFSDPVQLQTRLLKSIPKRFVHQRCRIIRPKVWFPRDLALSVS